MIATRKLFFEKAFVIRAQRFKKAQSLLALPCDEGDLLVVALFAERRDSPRQQLTRPRTLVPM
jgi:hypothetical protein